MDAKGGEEGRPQAAPRPPSRLVAIDLLRGFVTILMSIDHSSGEFNRGRLMVDGAFSWHAGTALPLARYV